jgi:catechol 2,3-dioxygenase-like lactoylglutathione lyase family enzyme
MSDLGLTHVALPVASLDASLAFWAKYAALHPVHQRHDEATGSRVAWITDRTRPFVLVLIETGQVGTPLRPIAHLGVGLESREAVDRLADEARREGRLRLGPTDSGYPVGYWALIADPDEHTLEISFGQEVALAVTAAEEARPGTAGVATTASPRGGSPR